MGEQKRAEHASKNLQATVNAFNKTPGGGPIIKKQVPESMMKGESKELTDLFMSRIDLT